MSCIASEFLRCPSCGNSFSYSKPDDSRIPLLLQCSHSICCDCVKLQEASSEAGQARCAKCHELTEFDADLGLPKNFYLLGLVQERNKDDNEMTQSFDETKECQCGKTVSTYCESCNMVICRKCFDESHNNRIWRKHKLVDPGQQRAIEKIRLLATTASSKKSSDIAALNTKQLPDLKKLKESFAAALEENIAVLDKFEKYRNTCKEWCEEACYSTDNQITELIALLQNLSKERKSELRSAFCKYQQRLDREINKDLWVEEINNFRAAINSIEDALNSNSQDLNYKTFTELLEKSVPAAIHELKISPLVTNPFGLEIDSEMEPSKIKKRIKIYAKLPIAGASSAQHQLNWPSLQLVQVKERPLKTDQSSKASNTRLHTTQQPSLSKSAEKPTPNQLPLEKADDGSSSESSCFSDEEELKKTRKAMKKNSSSGNGSVNIIHQKSDVSCKSHIDACMLNREAIARPKPITRGHFNYKPVYKSFSNNYNNSKFKGAGGEPLPKKFEIPDKPLIKFNYFDAKISSFSSFDEFYVQQVEPTYMVETDKLAKEMSSFYGADSNARECPRAQSHVSFCGVYKVDEVWHRCTVTRVFPEHYEIFLMDVGSKLKVSKDGLKLMHHSLTKYPKMAIKCRLADIKEAPKRSYTEKAIKSFKKLAMSSNGIMSVLVVKEPHKADAIPVVVYVFPDNGLRINLNAYMVERFDCVVSTGQESIGTISRDENVEPRKKSPIHGRLAAIKGVAKKLEVEILSCESPGKFFASFKHPEKDFENLELCIQNEAALLNNYKQLKGSVKETWRIGDYCYLKNISNSKDNKWYRGCIAGTLEWTSEQLDVFLIDQGYSIKVNPENLINAPDCVTPNRPAAAVKMHLDGAVPLGGSMSWNRSSVEMFKKVIQRFNEFCVSDIGESNPDYSLPVKLWGITYADGIICKQQEFHDIGAYLVNEGYVDRTFGPSSSKSKTAVSTEACTEDTDNANSPHTINAWIPAAQSQVGQFQGIVTEVDDEGTIYIQTRDQYARFNELKIKLTSQYLIFESEKNQEDLKLGQPVIVHQKVTGEFHRGIIEKVVKKSGFKVRLVDTGVVELAGRKDIFSNVIGAETPVLCQKFWLASVIPLDVVNCEWPKETLELIHGQIVDVSVTVVVSEVGDINKCSIKLDEKFQDIETILVDCGKARWRKNDDAWPAKRAESEDEDEVDVFVKEHLASMQMKVREERLDQIANALLKPASVEVSPEVTKRYLSTFEEDCNKEISESVMSMGSQKSVSLPRKSSSKTIVRTTNAFETVLLKKSKLKRTGVRAPTQIHFFDLQAADIDRFRCTFASVHCKTKLYVIPQIQELQEKVEDLERALEGLDENMLVKFKQLQNAVNKMCLVKVDRKCKRAMITSVTEDNQLVDVFLLDTAEYATVDAEFIFKMDVKVQKFPKKTLAVVLDGFKANRSLEEHDIEALVASTLENRELKAVVKTHDDKNFPVVELRDENDCLAYQTLIDSKVFIQIAP